MDTEMIKMALLKDAERTEEVQYIIERMPSDFSFRVTAIVIFIAVSLGLTGWFVKYPDVVSGQIVINGNSSPIRLVANSYGKLKINNVKSMQNVKEGQIIAYIENATKLSSVMYVDSIIRLFKPTDDTIMDLNRILPKNVSVGELNVKYYAFVSALQQLINYKKDRLYEKQRAGLNGILNAQQEGIIATKERVNMARNSLLYARKFYTRDSTLFIRKVISESELDKTQMSYLSSKDSYQNAISMLTSTEQQIQQTESKLIELGVTDPEKNKDLRIALISAYNDLTDNIRAWEQKYVFKSPYNGKVQFLKFYEENQFVQSGEQVFTVIPKETHALGQVTLPAQGSGKIKIGQDVVVKVDNYPYLEYGSITGKVNAISLTTSTTKTEKSDVDTYLILVSFPEQLKTNFGTKLAFKADAKGTAEIITNERRLIERLFDNLKYIKNR